MSELLRSNDPVLLGYAEVILRQVGIYCLIADQHISVLEGSIGAFPRRLLVDAEDLHAGRRALTEAGLAQWLIGGAERAQDAAMPAGKLVPR